MTTTLKTDTPAATIALAAFITAKEDKTKAEAAAKAAGQSMADSIRILETLVTGDHLTDAQRAQHKAANPLTIPGTQYGLVYRDYGKPKYADAIPALFAFIGNTKTVSVKKIKTEWERLLKVNTTPAWHGGIKSL